MFYVLNVKYNVTFWATLYVRHSTYATWMYGDFSSLKFSLRVEKKNRSYYICDRSHINVTVILSGQGGNGEEKTNEQ
jgi:hypothetical protein